MKRALGLILGLACGGALAEAPETSLRPSVRPDSAAQAVADDHAAPAPSSEGEAVVTMRPQSRPAALEVAADLPAAAPAPVAEAAPDPAAAADNPESLAALQTAMADTVRYAAENPVPVDRSTNLAIRASRRPESRPEIVAAKAAQEVATRARGAICGDPDIQGEAIADIHGSGPCGVDDPVRIRSILGIGFSEQPTIDCNTAIALKQWIQNSAVPTIGNTGGGLSRLEIMGHYVCRPRNNQRGEKLSEHSFGRAIDIGGFRLADGTVFTVLDDYRTRRYGSMMKTMHEGACGPFGTVLGPDANAAHRNHFHFDTAHYRNGAYCQ